MISYRLVQKKKKKEATNYCIRSLVMVRNQLPAQVVKTLLTLKQNKISYTYLEPLEISLALWTCNQLVLALHLHRKYKFVSKCYSSVKTRASGYAASPSRPSEIKRFARTKPAPSHGIIFPGLSRTASARLFCVSRKNQRATFMKIVRRSTPTTILRDHVPYEV